MHVENMGDVVYIAKKSQYVELNYEESKKVVKILHEFIYGKYENGHWRDTCENCLDCAEYQDSEIATELCKKCICYSCNKDRSECLKSKWCKVYKEEIEWN